MRYILQPYWLLDSLNKTAYIKEHFTIYFWRSMKQNIQVSVSI